MSKEYNLCSCGGRKSKQSISCEFCKRIETGNKTLKDFEYNNRNNAASKWCAIREHARKVAKRCGMYNLGCHNCGYDKHVEICHIKDIANCDLNTTLKEINDPNNLIQLCPNCHWEFDKGILDMDIPNRKLIDPYYLKSSCVFKVYLCECGREMSRNSKNCKECYNKKQSERMKGIDPKISKRKYRFNPKYHCQKCDNFVSSKNTKLCQSCYNKNRDKIVWPQKEELEELIENNSMVQIGKMLGVSDNAVKKRAKKYGILK